MSTGADWTAILPVTVAFATALAFAVALGFVATALGSCSETTTRGHLAGPPRVWVSIVKL